MDWSHGLELSLQIMIMPLKEQIWAKNCIA